MEDCMARRLCMRRLLVGPARCPPRRFFSMRAGPFAFAVQCACESDRRCVVAFRLSSVACSIDGLHARAFRSKR